MERKARTLRVEAEEEAPARIDPINPPLACWADRDEERQRVANLSVRHIRVTRDLWIHAINFFGIEAGLADLSSETIREYVQYLRTEDPRPKRGQTIKKHLGVLRRAFKVLAPEEGLRYLEPSWPTIVEDDEDESRSGSYVEPEQVYRVAAHLRQKATSRPEGRQRQEEFLTLAELIEFALQVGMRRGELERLRFELRDGRRPTALGGSPDADGLVWLE